MRAGRAARAPGGPPARRPAPSGGGSGGTARDQARRGPARLGHDRDRRRRTVTAGNLKLAVIVPGAAQPLPAVPVPGIWIPGLAIPISSVEPSISSVLTFDLEVFDIECPFDIDVLHLRYRMSISKMFDIEGIIMRYRWSNKCSLVRPNF